MQPASCVQQPETIVKRPDVKARPRLAQAIYSTQTGVVRSGFQFDEASSVEFNQSAIECPDEESAIVREQRCDGLRFTIQPAIALETLAIEREQPLRLSPDE